MKRKYDKYSDIELIDKFNHTGKMKYYDAFFFRYYPIIVGSYHNRYASSQQAIDEVQEILLELREEKKIPNKTNIRSWFYMVIRNKSIDNYRKRIAKKSPKIESFDKKGLEIMEKHESFRNDFEDGLDKTIASADQNLYEFINNMDIDQKNCIIAFYWYRDSYKEISELYNYELNDVKTYIQNGKRNIKIAIETKK